MNELSGISLILEGIVKEGIAHADHGLLFFADVVLELLVPHPVLRVLRRRNLVRAQLLYHFYVVDDVKNKRFDFRKE